MKNKNQEITFSLLHDSSVEELLIQQFSPSKNKLKKFFDKKYLEKKILAKNTIYLPLNFVNDGLINPVYIGPNIEIIYEDEIFLVLNKPSNIFVHPLTYDENNNCLSFLRSKHYKCLDVNSKNYDRGLLYRLDFETSGVLVYIKNNEDYLFFRNNFNQIAKEKIYYAKVEGNLKNKGLIENFLIGSEASGSKMKVLSQEKKDALHAKLIIEEAQFNKDKNSTLVKIKLLTGHRHQIRAQLSGLGHPIVGDELYGGSQSDRLYLHAYKYSLIHKNKSFVFEVFPNSFN